MKAARALEFGVVTILLATSCARDDGAPRVGSLEQAVISDQAHAGGVQGFYWLPPIVDARPAFEGAFDPTLSPTVRIDEIDRGTGRALRTLVTFTRASRGDERLEVKDHRKGDDKDEYAAAWHTERFHLDPALDYRVVALLDDRTLGVADVRLAKNKKDLVHVDTHELVPLVDGKALAIKLWLNACAAVACTALDGCHAAGRCDPATRQCSNPLRPGAECGDGNQANGDGCDNNCTRTACGNGVVTAGEQCDDGNRADGDACEADCTLARCGNGILDPGEICDDGNNNPYNPPNDTCGIHCGCHQSRFSGGCGLDTYWVDEYCGCWPPESGGGPPVGGGGPGGGGGDSG